MQKNSCSEVFCRKGVLKNFAKFTEKQLCACLFQLTTLLKMRVRHRCFPVIFSKFLRAPIL